MVDVFEQVEEELRSDRYNRLARKWLPIVGGLLAVALVAALAWWGWQSYQTSQADKASAAYDRGMEALAAQNGAAAQTAFAEAVKVGNGAYKSMALSQQAGIAIRDNRVAEGIRLFDEAAKAGGDPILSDPPALKAAYEVMNTGTLAEIEARLTPLAAEGRPLRVFAQEALALARLQHGKPAEARALFVQLQLGQDVPDTIRQRAQVGIEAIDAGTAANLGAIVRNMAAAPAPAAPRPAATAPAPAAPAPQARP